MKEKISSFIIALFIVAPMVANAQHDLQSSNATGQNIKLAQVPIQRGGNNQDLKKWIKNIQPAAGIPGQIKENNKGTNDIPYWQQKVPRSRSRSRNY